MTGLFMTPRRDALGLPVGASAIVTNGRLVSLRPSDQLVPEDFELLSMYANAVQIAEQVCCHILFMRHAFMLFPWNSSCDHFVKKDDLR
jgi:hypothetical protein